LDEHLCHPYRFIEGLMEMARIEAGEMHLRRRWGSVEEIITTALERAAPHTRNHHIQVRLEKELPTVRVDDRAVAEVIYTLVDNAAKYSPVGTNINVAANSTDRQTVQLSVEDEGPGIPKELRERVFDKFFRAIRDGDIGTHQPSGTGMGLAIAKGIVEAHGGRILVEDSPRTRGSRVVVTLPIGDDETALESSKGSGISEDERQAAHTYR
jgi:two-component system sensor histidine kinase KdpD